MPYLREEEFIYGLDRESVQIPIYNRYEEEVAKAIIDSEDLEKVLPYKWHLVVARTGDKYVITYSNRREIGMSHIILDHPQDRNSLVDHINSNTLDNRKSNLRPCTHAQNIRNGIFPKGISKYKGVYWCKLHKKWRARIGIDYRRIHLGLFPIEEDAAKAYNEAAIKHFGEFARLNIIEEAPKV